LMRRHRISIRFNSGEYGLRYEWHFLKAEECIKFVIP